MLLFLVFFAVMLIKSTIENLRDRQYDERHEVVAECPVSQNSPEKSEFCVKSPFYVLPGLIY
jgi:hypothetical protein